MVPENGCEHMISLPDMHCLFSMLDLIDGSTARWNKTIVSGVDPTSQIIKFPYIHPCGYFKAAALDLFNMDFVYLLSFLS